MKINNRNLLRRYHQLNTPRGRGLPCISNKKCLYSTTPAGRRDFPFAQPKRTIATQPVPLRSLAPSNGLLFQSTLPNFLFLSNFSLLCLLDLSIYIFCCSMLILNCNSLLFPNKLIFAGKDYLAVLFLMLIVQSKSSITEIYK